MIQNAIYELVANIETVFRTFLLSLLGFHNSYFSQTRDTIADPLFHYASCYLNYYLDTLFERVYFLRKYFITIQS